MHKMFTDLPADIVDRILTFLSDFKTLSAAIQTSKKHVYEVFQAHPKSIVLSIAYNIVGQALPHAVAMLDRTTKGGELEGETNADDDDNKVPDIADESATNDIQLSRKTADRLAFHAKVTWDLEDLYSLW